mgnify:CR=1 FL=1
MSNRTHTLPVTYREYRFSEDFPILLMRGTSVTPPSEREFLHFHNSIEIALCMRGRMNWNLENTECMLLPGDLCFLPPFFTHSSRFSPQQEKDVLCYYLFLNPEKLLASFYPGGLPQEFLWYRYTDFPKIFRKAAFDREVALIREIMEEMEAPGDFGHEMVRGLVQALMALLYCRFKDRPALLVKGSSIPALFPAIIRLEKDYTAYPDTALLARLCGLSRRHFLDEFKNSFHQTPLQYVRILRIQHACRLLTGTENSILDIALQTGFQSVSSFNRQFLALMGRSPQVFRNEKRSILKKDTLYAPYHQTKECINVSVDSGNPSKSSSRSGFVLQRPSSDRKAEKE